MIKGVFLERASTYNKAMKLQFSEPQLAKTSRTIPSDDNWVHEVKIDGYRMMVFYDSNTVKIISRHGKDWTSKFPKVVAAIKKLKGSFILDGELAVVDSNGRSDFQLLQRELRKKDSTKYMFFAFDILYEGKKDLRDLDLIKRKARLKKIIPKTSNVLKFVDHFAGKDGEALFELVKSHNLEGIVSKRAHGKYQHRRSGDWLKIKYTKEATFILGGFGLDRPTGKIKSVLLGERIGDKINYVGEAEFGLQILRHVFKDILNKKRKTSPFTNYKRSSRTIWVTPKFELRISYLERTIENKIRQAVIKSVAAR